MKSKCGSIVGKFKIKDGRNILVRYLKFEDWPECLKFINSLVEEDAMILVNKKFSKAEEIEWIKNWVELIEKDQAIVLVAELDGKIVGICNIKKGKFRERHVGTIGISVSKNYRNLGIGKILLQNLLELAKKKLGIKIARLEVLENNKIAIRFYKKLGFKTYGKLPKSIKYKGRFISQLFMYKEL